MNNAPFTDSWHANDTLWRIRELACDDLLRVMAQLPPADSSKHDLCKADFMDPARRATFHMIFIRKRVGDGELRWHIHQVQFEEH